MDAPPAPPRQVIKHICEYPRKPRDIIIEKWLPYKRSHPRKIIRVPPPPFEPTPRKNLTIIYEAVPSRNIYEVICQHHIIKVDNVEDYRQKHGDTLLSRKNLEETVAEELEKEHASQENVSHSVI